MTLFCDSFERVQNCRQLTVRGRPHSTRASYYVVNGFMRDLVCLSLGDNEVHCHSRNSSPKCFQNTPCIDTVKRFPFSDELRAVSAEQGTKESDKRIV
jgi:hypothetical protein